MFLIARLPFLRKYLTEVSGLLIMGGLLFLLFRRLQGRTDLNQCICKATLTRGERSLTVLALIDSGNNLTEPISGEKVCVVDQELYRSLWGDEEEGCRVIPYHSIGKQHGFMLGYLLPRLMLDADGMRLELADVYVAVSKERISGAETVEGEQSMDKAQSVRMIVHPGLLRGEEGLYRRGKRRNRQT